MIVNCFSLLHQCRSMRESVNIDQTNLLNDFLLWGTSSMEHTLTHK